MNWTYRHKHLYDERYYEWGKTAGVSWYDNYHWEPERSRAEAAMFLKMMSIRLSDCVKIVDFGCAKGFFVRALVEYGYDAYGIDISNYAREHGDPKVLDRLFDPTENLHRYNYGFCKDVLEHIAYEDIDDALQYMSGICPRWLMVVPLGQDGKYLISDYEAETTHIIREGVDWWVDHVSKAMRISMAALWCDGLKDKWWPVHRQGNLVLRTECSKIEI